LLWILIKYTVYDLFYSFAEANVLCFPPAFIYIDEMSGQMRWWKRNLFLDFLKPKYVTFYFHFFNLDRKKQGPARRPRKEYATIEVDIT